MSTPIIEYAGGVTLANVVASRREALARAPAWVRQLAARGGAAATVAVPAAKPARRFCGWLSGCVAPSVAVPCFNHADKLTVREQFTPACWERVLEQCRQGKHPISLQFRHGGASLASTADGTLTFNVHPICGLQFDARMRDDRLGRAAVAATSDAGLAVSIAYSRCKGWTVERDGGTVRVIDECIVDHVAMLPSNQSPAYRGARCYGVLADGSRPWQLQQKAQLYAWAEIKRQAGVKP